MQILQPMYVKYVPIIAKIVKKIIRLLVLTVTLRYIYKKVNAF